MSLRDKDKKNNRIGNYCLGAVLGRGASGTVYIGLGVENGDFVAIKQVHLQSLNATQLTSIMQEIDLLRDLNHPNIVKYISYEKTPEHLFIILEYVENGSLSSIVKKFGKFPESLVCVYITQVLHGLVYLHEQGVVHRDIKGANILTTKEGVIKLADFGVATKLMDKNESASFAGSPYWVAPEIIEMNGASAASDIWSVGCTVIELLTGDPPYFHMNNMSALYHIVQDDYPPLPDGISPTLKEWLMECFQKDPVMRITAKKLLKHRWIQSSRLKNGEELADPTNVTKNIQDYNEKLNATAKPSLTIYGPPTTKGQYTLKSPRNVVPQDKRELNGHDDSSTPSSHDSEATNSKEDWDAEFDIKKPDEALLSLKGLLSDLQPNPLAGTEIDDLDFSVAENKVEAKSNPTPRLMLPDMSVVDDMKNVAAKTPAVSLTKWAETGTGESEDDWVSPPVSPSNKGRNNKDSNSNGGGGLVDLASRLKQKFNLKSSLTSSGGASTNNTAALEHFVENDIFGEFDTDSEDEDTPREDDVSMAKDNLHKMSEQILKLMEELRPDQEEHVILDISRELIAVFKENPSIKSNLIRRNGVIPIMEMLEVSNARVIHSLLELVNQIIDDNIEIQKNLCLVGGIPAIMKFAHRDYSLGIRLECANFVLMMCSASTLTLQMVIACRGLPVLVDFLSTPYDESHALVRMSIDAISSVFELQSTTPRNDFCRLFSKCGLLKALAVALRHTAADADADAKGYPERIADVFLYFAQADSVVKRVMSDYGVLSVLFATIYSLSSAVLVKILKCIRLLAVDITTHENILQAGAIRRLIGVLGVRSGKLVTFMHTHVLTTLQKLCSISPQTLFNAVEEGVIPHLQYIILNSASALKQQALPLMCGLAHMKNARPHLWEHDGVEFYLNLLKEKYWQVNALDAISAWMADETQRVEKIVARPHHIEKIVAAFKSAQSDYFVALLEPLLNLLMTSAVVSSAVATTPIFIQELTHRLSQTNPQVRLYLLKILNRLCEQHPDPRKLVVDHKLYPIVKGLRTEKTVLVQKLARKLSQQFKKVASQRSLLSSSHQRRPSNTAASPASSRHRLDNSR